MLFIKNRRTKNKGGSGTGRTILYLHCKSTFDGNVLKKRNKEAALSGQGYWSGMQNPFWMKITALTRLQKKRRKYYYKHGDKGVLIDLWHDYEKPLYIFDAADVNDTEKHLKEIMPNIPLFINKESFKVNCPYCGCEQYTISNQGCPPPLTGFGGVAI